MPSERLVIERAMVFTITGNGEAKDVQDFVSWWRETDIAFPRLAVTQTVLLSGDAQNRPVTSTGFTITGHYGSGEGSIDTADWFDFLLNRVDLRTFVELLKKEKGVSSVTITLREELLTDLH